MNISEEKTQQIDTMAKMSDSIQKILFQLDLIKSQQKQDKKIERMLDFVKKQVIDLKSDLNKLRD